MIHHQDKINDLHVKLNILLKKQEYFSKEIEDLRIEIAKIKFSEAERVEGAMQTAADFHTAGSKKKAATNYEAYQQPKQKRYAQNPITPKIKMPTVKSDVEKFIGENLISKIGIIITVLGVAIGAKYSIDHDLISPVTRIILGYLSGLGLLGLGLKLKNRYKNYSAVLVSGAMAILYFITFFAFSFYHLMPHFLAFMLMIVFTVFTVAAAINYNKQIIAHIGLVGAYAVPFLLSDGTGQVSVLFTYMAIINIGILVISLKKYWKPLYYSSFGITWLIYGIWYIFSYSTAEHFGMALTFLVLFFSIFYAVFIAYKLHQKEEFGIDDIFLLLINSFFFYGLGYLILINHTLGEQLAGVFTLFNAAIHFMVGLIIYRQKSVDKNLFLLISRLGLIFVTIAILVQFDGNWVTLLWVGEAALLFWIGRTKEISAYEKLSYPLMILAFFSLMHDWATTYNIYSVEYTHFRVTPLLNITFLTSMLFVAAFGFITAVNRNKNYPVNLELQILGTKIVSILITTILLLSLYWAFEMEIANYFQQLYIDSAVKINDVSYHDFDLIKFKKIWILNYSLFFISVLAFVNFKKLKSQQLGFVNLVLIILVVVLFLTGGLYLLSSLRESYLNQNLAKIYNVGFFHIGIRYVSFAFIGLILFACYKYIQQDFIKWNLKIPFDILLYVSVLWIASSELIHWLDIARSEYTYKLGLSILWGAYSLFLIAMGIWQKKKYLRIGAIALFGITLIKLFFYDISHLNTIAKTIVFVSLGVLLLMISFLYNKYKHIISEKTDD